MPELPLSAYEKGFAAASLPGRWEILQENPPVILDGAHNPGAASVLASTLRRHLKGAPLAIVFGICGDKDVNGVLSPFGGLARRGWSVTIRNERSLPAAAAAQAAGRLGIETTPTDLASALPAALAWAKEQGAGVCIFGSLFLVGEVLEMRGSNDEEKHD